MSSSVATIRAQFENYECTLNTILCKLELSFESYATLQRSLPSDGVSPLVNPMRMIEKVRKMGNAVTVLKQEYEQLVADRTRMSDEFGQAAGDMEDKIRSTLEYLVAKK